MIESSSLMAGRDEASGSRDDRANACSNSGAGSDIAHAGPEIDIDGMAWRPLHISRLLDPRPLP
jgi:hypothetical protein